MSALNLADCAEVYYRSLYAFLRSPASEPWRIRDGYPADWTSGHWEWGVIGTPDRWLMTIRDDRWPQRYGFDPRKAALFEHAIAWLTHGPLAMAGFPDPEDPSYEYLLERLTLGGLNEAHQEGVFCLDWADAFVGSRPPRSHATWPAMCNRSHN